MEKHGIHFVHASDEWFILAEEPLPEADTYDGYLQLENGVGMLRLLETEVKEALEETVGDDRERRLTIATGRLAAPFLAEHIKTIQKKFPKVQAQVVPIINHFFGESITVSGLITGQDLIEQLSGRDLGERLLIPCSMLRDGEEVFLDDVTVGQVEEKLNIKLEVTDPEGASLVRAVCDLPRKEEHKRRQIYEQTGSGYRGETECG